MIDLILLDVGYVDDYHPMHRDTTHPHNVMHIIVFGGYDPLTDKRVVLPQVHPKMIGGYHSPEHGWVMRRN